MLNRLILKVTKFHLPPPKRLGTVVKNILGDHHGPPCQIGLMSPPPPLSSFLSPVLHNLVSNIPTAPPYCIFTKSLLILKLHLGEDLSTAHSPFQNQISAIQLVQYHKIGKCFILFFEMLVPKGVILTSLITPNLKTLRQ